MSLTDSDDEEPEYRAMERMCADPKSSARASKTIVKQLAALSLADRKDFLHNSVIWGLGHLVRCALKAQVSANVRTAESLPLIALGAGCGASTALKALLVGGANIELADDNGQTALIWAAKKGQLSCLQLLLDGGANVNAQDCLGHTPLMTAVAFKQVECARAAPRL